MCAAHKPGPPLPFQAMAYNVLYSSTEEDASLGVIEAELPDVLCLTEVTPGFSESFRRRLGQQYPHTFFAPRAGTWGVGIASRHPLRHGQRFAQKPHRMPAAEAQVKLGGRWLKVVCAHLMPPGAQHKKTDDLFDSMEKNAQLREKQGAELVKRYEKETGPVLLLGDMNETREGAAMRAFATAGFLHACDGPQAACGATWPGATSVMPAVAEIDHILGRGLVFSDARVLRKGGSDHYPVQVRFDFAPPTAAPPAQKAP
jgi:endonuclease/exonuclease/phosphatase (EEP) superfamily protein YafD